MGWVYKVIVLYTHPPFFYVRIYRVPSHRGAEEREPHPLNPEHPLLPAERIGKGKLHGAQP